MANTAKKRFFCCFFWSPTGNVLIEIATILALFDPQTNRKIDVKVLHQTFFLSNSVSKNNYLNYFFLNSKWENHCRPLDFFMFYCNGF